MELDSLEIRIQDNARSAASGLDALEASLARLKTSAKGGAGLTTLSKGLERLTASLSRINAYQGRLTQLQTTLAGLGGAKTNLTTTANQLTKLNAALNSLNTGNVEKMQALSSALTSLSAVPRPVGLVSSVNALAKLPAITQSLGTMNFQTFAAQLNSLTSAMAGLAGVSKAGGFTSTLNALARLPKITQQLGAMNMEAFAAQIQKVAAAMKPLATEMQKVAAGFSAFPARIQRVIASNEKLVVSNRAVSKSFSLLNIWSNIFMFQWAAQFIAGWVSSANDYIENVNLFQVSMGEFYEEAFEYANLVSDRMGIDPSEWMRTQGVFMSMANGFGMARQQAYDLSEGLTELAYDLSSLYNEDVEQSALRLQSALAGEIEPIRRLGISISQATLQEYALEKGINESVMAMTEQEKALLRSLVLMEGASRVGAIGDFAKTLESPANALRVLRQQIHQLAIALGTLLLPMLIQIIPWVQAFVEVLTEAIRSLAILVGFEMPEWDANDWGNEISDGAIGISDAMDDATASAKALKSATIGIDELNIISPPSSSGSGSAGEGLSSWAESLEIPDIWDKTAIAEIQTKADALKKTVKEILPIVVSIGAAFAAWKIGNALITGLTSMLMNLKTILPTLAVVAGLAVFLYNAFDAVANGVNFQNLTGMLAGLAVTIGALVLLGNTLLAQFFAIAGGIAIVGISILDMVENGLTFQNLTGVVAGLTVMIIGLSAAFGKVGTIIGAVIGAVTLLTIGFNDFIANGATNQNILAIGAGFGILAVAVGSVSAPIGIIIALVGAVTLAFLTFGDKALGALNVVASAIGNAINWMRNLMTAALAVFENIGNFVGNVLIAIKDTFFAVVENIQTAFSNAWINIQISFWGLVKTLLEGIEFIGEKINSLTSIFGIEIDLSGISDQIDALAETQSELSEELEDFTDIGAAWESGMSTYSYRDVGEAFNTFEAFEEGWVDEAYSAGQEFGANLQQGLQDTLAAAKSAVTEAVGDLTSGLFGGDTSSTMENVLPENYEKLVGLMQEQTSMLSTDTKNEISGIQEFFSNSMTTTLSDSEVFTDNMVKMYEAMADSSNAEIQSIISNLDSIPRNITTVHTIVTQSVSGGSSGGGSSVSQYASGGFPEPSQLFIAREAGPELVGTIGARTAVANNDQIVEGIARGVEGANSQQNALLREQNELLRAILAKEGTIRIGNKVIKQAYDAANRASGVSIMAGGVMG